MPNVLYEIRHTYPCRRLAVLRLKNEVLVVYLRLKIVSITLTSTVLDVVGGGGSDLPSAGMLPAKIEVDSAHISASAIANRFMGFCSFEVEKMPKFLHEKEWNNTAGFLGKVGQSELLSRWHSLNFSLIESLNSHADDLSEVGYLSPYRKPRS